MTNSSDAVNMPPVLRNDAMAPLSARVASMIVAARGYVVAAAVERIERALELEDLLAADKEARDLRKALLKGGTETRGVPTSVREALLLEVDALLRRLQSVKGVF
jgi:hypothetical protein